MMPELAEVRTMKEFINLRMKDNKAMNFYMNPDNISYFSLPNEVYIPLLKGFDVKAYSRGKELQLVFNDDIKITFTLGMTGNFQFFKFDEIEDAKYVHFTIETENGYLCFVDKRKFGKWKLRDWNSDRGFDIIDEHSKFKDKILQDVKTVKLFEKPLYEVLMDQKYFNGIGNYLRSTIIYYLDESPFISLKDLYNKNVLKYIRLMELCREVPLHAYELGGGQLKDWINPFNVDSTNFNKWVYYKKGLSLKDSKNRSFWFHPKWNNS